MLLDSIISQLYAISWVEKEGIKTAAKAAAASGGGVGGANNNNGTSSSSSSSSSVQSQTSPPTVTSSTTAVITPVTTVSPPSNSSSVGNSSGSSDVSILSDPASSNDSIKSADNSMEVTREEYTKELMLKLLEAVEVVKEATL